MACLGHGTGGFLALAAAPHGFIVAEFTAKVSRMTGQACYTARQGAHDLRKLTSSTRNPAGPAATRSRQAPPTTIADFLALRDHVIALILADVRSPRLGREPAHWTRSTSTTRPSSSAYRPSSASRPSRACRDR